MRSGNSKCRKLFLKVDDGEWKERQWLGNNVGGEVLGWILLQQILVQGPL